VARWTSRIFLLIGVAFGALILLTALGIAAAYLWHVWAWIWAQF
jgi:hypothetical protein